MFHEIPWEQYDVRLRQMLLQERLVEPTVLDDFLQQQIEACEANRTAPRLSQFVLLEQLVTPSRLEGLVRQLEHELREEQALKAPTAPDAPYEVSAPADRLGRYEILGELGRGGIGVVYKARDPQLDRIVALKVLRPRMPAEHVQRLQREGVVTARLSHPGIIVIHEFGQYHEDGEPRHFISMDYIDGPTLHEAMPDLELRERIQILERVARAVEHAHQAQIIHRDLKPDNVLIAPDGHPVVTDFGLAGIQDAATQLTHTGQVLGTPFYMSPEQVLGKHDLIDQRTDVWALGVMLHQMLSEDRPFSGSSPGEVFDMILAVNPATLTDPEIPAPLILVSHKAMRKQPHARYQSAAELADELARWLAGEPVQAQGLTTFSRLTARLRNRGAVLAVGLLLCALLIGGGSLAGQYVSRTRSRAWLKQRVQDAEARERTLERLRKAEQSQSRRAPGLQALRARILEFKSSLYVADVDLSAQTEPLTRALNLVAQHPASDDSEPWTLQGMGWYFLGNTRLAKKSLLRAVAIDPQDGWANHYLGRIYIERAMAVRWLAIGGGAGHVDRAAAKAIAHIRPPAAWDGSGSIEQHIARTYLALAQGKTETALRLCREGRLRFPNAMGREEFWMAASWVHRKQARVDDLTRALKIRPHYAWALFARGGALARLKKTTEALRDYDQAIRLNPRMALAFNSRACYFMAQKQPERGMRDINQAIRLDPRFAQAYSNRAIFLLYAGKLRQALADHNRAIQIDPTLASAWSNRGSLRVRLKQFKLALADFAHAIVLDPTEQKFHTNRGRVFAAHGQKARALNEFTAAIRLAPENHDPYVERGALYRSTGELPKAQVDIERALKLAPEHWRPHFERGRINLILGKLDAADRDLSHSLKIFPNAQTFFWRAHLRRKLGHPGAVDDFRRALALKTRSWRAWQEIARGLAEGNDYRNARVAGERALKWAPAQFKPAVRAFLNSLPG